MNKNDRDDKLLLSFEDLSLSLNHYHSVPPSKRKDRRLAFLSLSKAFEVAVECAWKELKRRVMAEGLDPQSPKAAVREAAKIGIINDPEAWFLFINTRNSGVHDYFSVSEKEYVAIADDFNSRSKLFTDKSQDRFGQS